jgi:hypothetical protein
MNLHGIVSGVIGAINPFVLCTVKRSTGYTTQADGTQVPQYATFTASVQVQALSNDDLQHLDSLNIQGIRRAVYLTGEVENVVRVAQEGGDLLIFPQGVMPEGTTWLCTQVLEQWPDWRKIAIVLQVG